MRQDNGRTRAFLSVVALTVAAAMFVAAAGSGNPETLEPLPDWINTGANLICVVMAFWCCCHGLVRAPASPRP